MALLQSPSPVRLTQLLKWPDVIAHPNRIKPERSKLFEGSPRRHGEKDWTLRGDSKT